jgi:hypothetical protein
MSTAEIVPSHWAGGKHVCIPGLGVGRIIGEDPRVIEIALPAPECAVFLVDELRAVVLVDPRVSRERTRRAVDVARQVRRSGLLEVPGGMPVAVGDGTPPCGMPAVATYPRLRAVRPGQPDPRG